MAKLQEKEFYEKLRKTAWKRGPGENIHAAKLLNEMLSELFRSYKGRILDLGCGESDEYPIYKDTFSMTVGVDIAEAALKQSKKIGVENLVLADIRRLPFKEKSFDLIFSDQVLEHIMPLESVLREIKRTGRNFIITVPNEKLLTQRIINRLIGYDPATIGHVISHNNTEWLRLLSGRLSIKKTRGIFLFNLLNMPSLRMFHSLFCYIEKKVNIPRFSFYLIYVGSCNGEES